MRPDNDLSTNLGQQKKKIEHDWIKFERLFSFFFASRVDIETKVVFLLGSRPRKRKRLKYDFRKNEKIKKESTLNFCFVFKLMHFYVEYVTQSH